MQPAPDSRFEAAFTAWAAGVIALWVAQYWPLADADAVWPAWLAAALSAPARGSSPLPWLCAAAALVALWTCAGRRAVRALAPAGLGAAEELGFAACTGLGTGATLLAVLALAGQLTPRAIAWAALAWGAVALVPVRARSGGGARSGAEVVDDPLAHPRADGDAAAVLDPPLAHLRADGDTAAVLDPPLALALCAAALSALVALLHALTPPWQPDALYYQLTMPRLWLEGGGFVPRPEEPVVSGYPGLGQMLFAVAIAPGRDDLAAFAHWAHLPLLALGAYALAAGIAGGGATGAPRAAHRRAGWLAVACLGAVPQLFATASVPLVDVITAAHLTWALHAAVRAGQTGDARWAALGALPLGFALANKYLALPAAALLWAAQAAALAWRRGALPAARSAVLVAVLAALPCVPWAVRNVRDWGSPAFPLHVPAGAPASVRSLVREHQRGFAANGAAQRWWRLPIDVTFAADPDDIQRFQGVVGPLVLVLMPLLLARPRRRSAALALYALALLSAWAIATRQVRFLYPALPPLLAAAVTARREPRALAPAVAACALLALVWTAGRLRPANDLPYVTGREPRHQYYRSLSATAGLMAAYDALAPEPPGRVALFWEYRGYHCPRPFLPEHAYRLYGFPREVPALLERLKRMGVSHVLVNRSIWDEQRDAGEPFPFGPTLDALARHPGVRRVPLPAQPGPLVELYRLPP